LTRASRREEDVFISPITAWEVGLLLARGRLTLPLLPEVWFRQVISLPGLRLAAMPPEVLFRSSFLPGNPPRDPADRILLATAREYGYRLVTRDEALLSYAQEGHIQALAC
jgi:PIN domain nuclease of toxin-antitoxin system